ncbi:MAG: hypothetical protein Q4G22_07260 [Paracoccus sp. (in: a-proteobacteria)]|uniref:hypothetical protein n=1 Tax=Paracoccus sp. TaxID=267 RepID=UPI0026E0B8AF|nr:hypothetical protein [Paracoccus sp. (in: a-proteobacteria)]MDO5631620.1 hypothetical protein [Paracoccus sp. (in: a-proteobacteria)]
MNKVARFCYWCQSVSDRLAERRKRIARFRDEYARQAQYFPALTQAEVDAAAAGGMETLLSRLTLERDKAAALCNQIERDLGPKLPKYEHWIGIDQIVKQRISDLDIKGVRWIGQKFLPPRKPPLEPAPDLGADCAEIPWSEQEYLECRTGRIISHGEYEAIGGPGRCAEFVRVR